MSWGKGSWGKGMGKMESYMMSWMAGMGPWDMPSKGKGKLTPGESHGGDSKKGNPSREEFIQLHLHKKIAAQAKPLSNEAIWHLGKHNFSEQFDELARLLAGGAVEDAPSKKAEYPGFAPSEWLSDEFLALRRMTDVDQSFKNKWEEHCKAYGHKMYDVRLHEHDFVLGFVTAYKAENGINEIPGLQKKVSIDVIDQFKDMQRNDNQFKAAWEEHIGLKGKRDPRVHPEEELMKFMTDYTNNALPGNIKGKDTPMMMDNTKDVVVSQLKELQRTDTDAKEMWRRYCLEHGDGMRDPAVHPEEFVKKFVDAYKSNNLKALKINLSDASSGWYGGMGGGKGKGKGYGGWWGPY
eukprot:gnl/TRDRNA2_/TRDRNA2_174320_c2_seq1.p1 gnl/TRDRNA2_/TRDRNA2_174320_c2~~gnl/TRDRNA2_/TRDRNA2_174320_c2_seq1.p1  ORF type:complete len:351 (+),score=66.36 gnl/TRDRNA2_/TRDRNA2_174320_c2_seq1:108-1160(+)